MSFGEKTIAGNLPVLTSTLFSAALGQVPWTRFTDAVFDASGGVKTHIVGYDAETSYGVDMATSGYDPHYIETWRAHHAAINAWAPGLLAQPIGQVVDSAQMCADDMLRRTEFYADWVRPQEDIVRGGAVLLFKEPSRTFVLGGNIRNRDGDRAHDAWLQGLALLAPHVRMALEVTRALAGAKLETLTVARHGLASVPGIFILSDMGLVRFANDIGQAMIDDGDPVGIDRWGRLMLSNTANPDPDWQIRGQTGSKPAIVRTLANKAHTAAFDIRIVDLTTESGIGLPLERMLGLSGRCSIVILSRRQMRPDLARMLMHRFGLTQSEAEVALAVHSGSDLRAIAGHREASIHTVRHQIKSGMSKIGVNRQADLVREIERLIKGLP